MTDPGSVRITEQVEERRPLAVFVTLLVGVVLSTIVALSISSHRSSTAAIDELWSDSSSQLLARVVLHLRTIYEPGARAVQYSEHAVQSGQLSTSNDEKLFAHLTAVIDSFPTVIWASFATPEGTYFSVYRWPTEDGAWEIRRTKRVIEDDDTTRFVEDRREESDWVQIRDERAALYDPRTRQWYHAAVAAPDVARWNRPRVFHSRGQLGLHHSMASREPATRRVTGVWAMEFEAGPVSEYLSGLHTRPGTRIYVLNEDGLIVSSPDGELVKDGAAVTAATTADQLLSRAWTQITTEKPEEGVVFEMMDQVVMFRRMPATSGLPWYVIVTLPRDALHADTRDQARLSIAVGLVGIILSILLTVGAATVLNRRVRERVLRAINAAKIGNYQLIAKLGQGGAGAVYEAQHAMLRRPTAVKILLPRMSTPKDIARFEREVRMTCRLTHPNTVTVFDYGQTPDGRFYYAMELVDGVTLGKLLDFTGPLPPGRVIFLLQQVCAALAEAHEAGLIHRDIKPANLLVGEMGGRGDFVKIVDFGLVKEFRSGADELTRENDFVGTPGFLAPEVQTLAIDVGPLADVYSVGAVAYTLLSDTEPFYADSPLAVYVKQQTTDPEPPSKWLDEALPTDLEALVMSCLSRDMDGRPPSAAALHEALSACRDAGSWTAEDAAAWWEAHGDELRAIRDAKRDVLDAPTLIHAVP